MDFITLISRLPAEIVEQLKATEQNEKYHAEGDVYKHSEMVFNETLKYNDIDLMIAAIFHDLGKIDTHTVTITSTGYKKISHPGHEVESLKYVDNYIYLYEDLNINKEKVYEIVKNHMRSHLYISGEMSRKFKRKTFEDNKYFKVILIFTECDEKGRIINE